MLFEAQGKYYISNECCLFILKRKIDPREPKIVSNKKHITTTTTGSFGRMRHVLHQEVGGSNLAIILSLNSMQFLKWQPYHSSAEGYRFHQNYHTIEMFFFVMASGGFILLFTSQFTVPSNEKLNKSIYHRAFIK